MELALTYDLTAYDACYGSLAQQIHLPLITADNSLFGKLNNSEIEVRHLTDLNL